MQQETDQYVKITNLTKKDPELIATIKWMWVGVDEFHTGIPVPKAKAKHFKRCNVFLYKGRYIVAIKQGSADGVYRYYYIPDDELQYITEWMDVYVGE